MTSDLLLEATQALRDAVDADHADSRAARARILSTLRHRRSGRRVRALSWVPLAACVATVSAWAATKPVFPTLWHGAAEAFCLRTSIDPVQRPSAATVVQTPPPSEAPRTDTTTFPASPEPTVMAPVDTPRPMPVERAESAHRAAPSTQTPAAVSPSSAVAHRASAPALDVDREHELYRAAHRAHFVAQDPAAALTAWDAYLTAAPTGRFAVEARYNRALCLLRLGRADAARAALTPFAEGTFGAYRRREAAELLRALTDP
jgi:hypothetical protein